MDHYRELVVRPAWKAFCDAEVDWHKIEHELYQVEVALGMRGRILALTISPSEGKVQREIDEFHADPPRRLRARNQKLPTKQLLIDDGEVNNDI